MKCDFPVLLASAPSASECKMVFSMTNVRKLFIAQGVLGANRLANERWQSKHEREHEAIKGMSVDIYKYRNKNKIMLIPSSLFFLEADPYSFFLSLISFN